MIGQKEITIVFYSQIGQDKFVVDTLSAKKDCTFLDVGSHHYKSISNTYYLETELNWTGIGIDSDYSFMYEWNLYRKNSKFICCDAVTINYGELLSDQKLPSIIDYLSIDLEPPILTLRALEKIFETDYIFRVVTFETDAYRQPETRDISREMFKSAGYIFVEERNCQDDFYIHSSLA